MSVEEILLENEKRKAIINAPFDPITGYNSIGERKELVLSDFPISTQYLPIEMFEHPLIKALSKYSSIADFIKKELQGEAQDSETDRLKVIKELTRLRCLYDFPFWAATFVYIKNKGGGEDVLFRLTRPQRKFVLVLESMRKANKPIRVILLKARQWGGSTTSQIYMAWLQLVHKKGLDSLIIAHLSSASDKVKAMFDKMISKYPVEMLYDMGERYSLNEKKMIAVGKSGNIYRVPQRSCNINVGTVESPDSSRGGDYNLVHLSEVGVWKATEGKKPEDIVRAACSGVLFNPYTMIVYESTANGTGNFFQREYDAAKKGDSQLTPLFISWFDIDLYSISLTEEERYLLAYRLIENKNNANSNSNREASGKYLWSLWERGATLEAIKWYIVERSKYNEDGQMASEYPSDDVEAFTYSGSIVFDKYDVEVLKKSCKQALATGELVGNDIKGENSIKDIKFVPNKEGLLWIWNYPDIEQETLITNRYLVCVDVGGRSEKADYSVIVVFDRVFMMEAGGTPLVVAQWYGHCDMDILAWKAAQIATYYDNALLVIEKNTINKYDHERQRIDDNYEFLLVQLKNSYDNLYARRPSEDDIREGRPRKYGFHTNISTKPVIIENLRSIVRDGLYIERDERCLNEYLAYEQKENGSYGAIIGKHDDLVMTRAIGLYICYYEMDLPKVVKRQDRYIVAKKKYISEATI